MKINKLKYVFAFVLLVAISVVSANVQAATSPIRDVRSIVRSVLASSKPIIVDGDDPGTTVTVDRTIESFNTTYELLGMNPVQAYTLNVKSSGASLKAYSLSATALTKQNAEFNYNGQVGNDKVGLGLAFGLNYLTADELANQADMNAYAKSYSAATQLYVWLAYNNQLGTATENTEVGKLDGQATDLYYYIRNSVDQSVKMPSYAYGSEAEAKTNKYEMAWNEANGRYEVTLTDDNGLDTMALVNLSVTPGSGISYSKNGNTITFYSADQVGSVSNPVPVVIRKSINGGRYVAGKATTTDGQDFTYLMGNSRDNDTYYAAFYTNALRVKVQKQLKGSNTNPNTGDATVAGAKYGVYRDNACTDLVEELVTDSNGVAMTRPLDRQVYYIKEIAKSEGCKINNEVLTASPDEADVDSNGQLIVTKTSKEDVIYGGFRMIVSHGESSETTKQPSVGSKMELVLKSNTDERYETTVDATGYADFTNIPYGQYTCLETEKPNGRLDYMDPMDIFINTEKTFIYSKIVNTQPAERKVRIIKKDAESGKIITGSETVYRVEDNAGNPVIQTNYYPKPEVLTQYSTADKDGIYGWTTLPQKLIYGTYKVYEVTAPYGYYNQSLAKGQTIASFTVNSNDLVNDEHGNPIDTTDRTITVVVNTENKPQKANLTISAKGNVLTGTNHQAAYGQPNVERPAYQVKPIPGATYSLTANENIVTGDGVVHMKKGDTIPLGTTDSNGQLKTKLYLGSYTIRMTSVPEGYVLDTEERTITADYKGQTIEEYDLPVENYTLTRQDYDLDVKKLFTGLNFYKQGSGDKPVAIDEGAYRDVIVGIYAAEDITNVLGETKIAKDTLVDVVIFDKDGNGTFASEYPMGKFYAKEIQTNINYVKTDKHYDFVVKPTNNSDPRFNISVGEIVNEAVKETKFKFTKIEEMGDEEAPITRIAKKVAGLLLGSLADYDEEDIIRLEGAEVAIAYLDEDGEYYPLLEKIDDKFVEVVRTTDENGEFTVEGLPIGSYAIVEITAPRYYELDENPYGFVISATKKEAEVVLQDVRTKVDVSFAIVDEDGNKLKDAKVQLVDPETNKVAYEEETNEEGIAVFEQIRAGRYIRRVASLEKQYVTPKTEEVYLEKDQELVETVKVKFITGNILINKTDDETGEAVPECLFAIKNEEGETVVEARTDDNGQLLVVGLRYGKYTVEEIEAAENYEKSDLVVDVEVLVDGYTYVVDYTNVNTGDIAVALYAVIALVSVAAITITVKKLRRN